MELNAIGLIVPNQFLLNIFARRSELGPLLRVDLPQHEGAENSVLRGLTAEADEAAELEAVSSTTAPIKKTLSKWTAKYLIRTFHKSETPTS